MFLVGFEDAVRARGKKKKEVGEVWIRFEFEIRESATRRRTNQGRSHAHRGVPV